MVTVSDDVLEQFGVVMAEYECDSPAEVIETAATVALNQDKAELAQSLADRLAT